MNKKTIAIIASDLNSINYEIILKSISFFKKKTNNNYLFIGSKKILAKNLKKNIKFLKIKDIEPNDSYLKNSFDKYLKLYKKKKVHGLINLPLNKKKFLGKSFPGITEYMSKMFNCSGNETMLLYNHKFSVSPLTTHIKIKDISKNLSPKKMHTNYKNILNFYKNIIKIKKPIIGVLGLNPHNAIDFSNNCEEKQIILPTLKKLRKKYKNKIVGPISPDSSFTIREKKKINCLIGMYHDQILTSFKYINKVSAINITL